MVNKKDDKYIPLIYAFLYFKIKKKMRGNRIIGSELRKIIQKEILCEKSGGPKGVPRRYCYDIIKDIVELGLIERIGKTHNDPIFEDNSKKVLEVSERLNDWKISKKLRANKKVDDKLGAAIKILDKDPLYRVTKSQCDRQLKQAFWWITKTKYKLHRLL